VTFSVLLTVVFLAFLNTLVSIFLFLIF
jgi:hypothetical protein